MGTISLRKALLINNVIGTLLCMILLGWLLFFRKPTPDTLFTPESNNVYMHNFERTRGIYNAFLQDNEEKFRLGLIDSSQYQRGRDILYDGEIQANKRYFDSGLIDSFHYHLCEGILQADMKKYLNFQEYSSVKGKD